MLLVCVCRYGSKVLSKAMVAYEQYEKSLADTKAAAAAAGSNNSGNTAAVQAAGAAGEGGGKAKSGHTNKSVGMSIAAYRKLAQLLPPGAGDVHSLFRQSRPVVRDPSAHNSNSSSRLNGKLYNVFTTAPMHLSFASTHR